MVMKTSLFSLLSIAGFAAAQLDPRDVNVLFRIEGPSSTINWNVVFTRGKDVTTPSGGTHKCDGTNGGANSQSSATILTALADSKVPWDGTWDSSAEDFKVTKIKDISNASNKVWSLLVNYKYHDDRGCRTPVNYNDEVILAYDAKNADAVLKLTTPPNGSARPGEDKVITITNGLTGEPVQGATVDGKTTDADGKVTLSWSTTGVKKIKAEKPGSIRSNEGTIVVF